MLSANLKTKCLMLMLYVNLMKVSKAKRYVYTIACPMHLSFSQFGDRN